MMKTSLYGAARVGRVAAGDDAPSLSGDAPLFTSRRRGRKLLASALACAALVAGAAAAVSAQRVYGVATRRTVVATGSGVAVHSRTVVASRPALPGGYIAVLPAGYRVVGGGIFMAGGVRYRATFYQGRTVYIRL